MTKQEKLATRYPLVTATLAAPVVAKEARLYEHLFPNETFNTKDPWHRLLAQRAVVEACAPRIQPWSTGCGPGIRQWNRENGKTCWPWQDGGLHLALNLRGAHP